MTIENNQQFIGIQFIQDVARFNNDSLHIILYNMQYGLFIKLKLIEY